MKEIKLNKGFVALVDDEDYERVNQFTWWAMKRGHTYYALTEQKNKCIQMHRFILGLTDPKILTDHKDHNGLNNQRCNIRPCDSFQNNSNRNSRVNSTSKYLGVSWKSANSKWCVQIQQGKKKLHVGMFNDEHEAAKAYNEAAVKHFGEFANLNPIYVS